MAITKKLWGTAPDGKEIFLYTLTNASGAYVQLCSVGAEFRCQNAVICRGRAAAQHMSRHADARFDAGRSLHLRRDAGCCRNDAGFLALSGAVLLLHLRLHI